MATATETTKAQNGTEPAEPKSLHYKLAEVMAEIGTVEERGRNEDQKYDYATDEDIFRAVRDKLAERHIILLPAITEINAERKTISGKQFVTQVKGTWTFVDGESGERHEVPLIGEGADSQDKGVYKAYTGALKYLLRMSFLIPTGNDPELQGISEEIPLIEKIDGERVATLTDLAQAWVTEADKAEDQRQRRRRLETLLRSVGMTGEIASFSQAFATLTPGQAGDVEEWLRDAQKSGEPDGGSEGEGGEDGKS
jgi:hypothetical protein